MAETRVEYPQLETLEDLAGFDPLLEARIAAIRAGLSPNGENPNGILGQALEGGDPKDETAFINEYAWALSLAAFPYRKQEPQAALRSAAIDGLFIAGETYDPKKEPNFLKHMSVAVGSYLHEVFGDAETHELPPADEFEAFVLANWQPVDEPVITAEDSSPRDELETGRASHRNTRSMPPVVMQLQQLGPNRRMAAYRAGKLTRRQLTAWAGWFPDEIPLINDEVEWIACNLVDLE